MKKFFKKVWFVLASFFANIDEWIDKHVQPSIKTVQALKAIVDGPFVGRLVSLTPTHADDRFKKWLSETLEKAIVVLQASKAIDEAKTLDEKLQLLVQYIRTLSPSMRKGLYKRLAVEMAIASGNKTEVKGHAVDLLVQLEYTKFTEGRKLSELPDNLDWDDDGDGVISEQEYIQHRYC